MKRSKKLEALIYDLILNLDSEKTEFNINLNEYVKNEEYDLFVKEIKTILKKAKVQILKDKITVIENGSASWELKLKK
jgi:hypothetical protein